MTIFLHALLAISAPPAVIVLARAGDLLWIQRREGHSDQAR